MIDTLLKYILGHEFLNDLDAQSDFDKHVITKKVVKQNHSYLKYALVFSSIYAFFECRLDSVLFHCSPFLKGKDSNQGREKGRT